MKPLEIEFETNANSTGMQQFLQIECGVTLTGKPVYIYQRTYSEGKRTGQLFGFEVVIPSVKKAGTYPLPGGKTITYTEDFEEYPGASKFGFSAWSYPSYQPGAAKCKFKNLTEAPVEVEEVEDANDEPTLPEPAKGRPKAVRPPIVLPETEFSVKELAEQNKTEYPYAFLFVKEQVAAGKVKLTRKERRATRGPETQLYSKV